MPGKFGDPFISDYAIYHSSLTLRGENGKLFRDGGGHGISPCLNAITSKDAIAHVRLIRFPGILDLRALKREDEEERH